MDLEAVFRAHQREIYVYFLRTVSEAATAEDLAQETFLRAWRSATLYRGDSSIRTWLFAIARITLADHLRKRPAERAVEARELSGSTGISQEISSVLASLPVIAREALVLCDVLGFTPSEAADILRIDVNALRVRLHRARRRFREVYLSE